MADSTISIATLKEGLKRLTPRERLYIGMASAMILCTLIYQAYKPINEAFRAQTRSIAELKDNMQFVTAALNRYVKLKTRQTELQQTYQRSEFKEGALSYLESLVREKAGIAPGNFTIRDKSPREFGGDYEQTPFTIKFVISDYSRLLAFLKELTHGEHRMLLSSLDIKRRPAGDALEVELDVSSVRRINKQTESRAENL